MPWLNVQGLRNSVDYEERLLVCADQDFSASSAYVEATVAAATGVRELGPCSRLCVVAFSVTTVFCGGIGEMS